MQWLVGEVEEVAVVVRVVLVMSKCRNAYTFAVRISPAVKGVRCYLNIAGVLIAATCVNAQAFSLVGRLVDGI